jgi:NTE family protein
MACRAAALVLQGGGALGAFEFGAARALFERGITPDIVAGVSIGAITAVLLARPAERLGPLGALEAFWKKVTVPGFFVSSTIAAICVIFRQSAFLHVTARLLHVADHRTFLDVFL